MDTYKAYLEHLQGLSKGRFERQFSLDVDEGIAMALNGQPSLMLRALVPISTLKNSGIFLTPTDLASKAVQLLASSLDQNSAVLDPACGAGDLLIAAGNYLTRFASGEKPFAARLLGIEQQPVMADTARARLLLAFPEHPCLQGLCPSLRQGCGLANRDLFEKATHILLNPPFCMVDAPEDCSWSKGKINQAAYFLDSCLAKVRPGVHIVAILPEVLRSGSRYGAWRANVEKKAEIIHMQIYGRFDSNTDIDVFICHLRVRDQPQSLDCPKVWATYHNFGECIGDHFTVRVGPVVDYRDPHEGPRYPFITSRCMPIWSEDHQIPMERNFLGAVFRPPFIVIRRTSSPSDVLRIKPALIVGKQNIAVENHLLVLIPHENSLVRCQQLMRYFRSPEINQLVNERIRCRHLTVSSISRLPLGASFE